jgi:uncharacterized protein YjiS (DUF1127 family)
MSVVTMDSVARSAPRRSFLARLIEAIAASQMSKARAIAKPHLLALDDEELAVLGHRREDVRRWESLSNWV